MFRSCGRQRQHFREVFPARECCCCCDFQKQSFKSSLGLDISYICIKQYWGRCQEKINKLYKHVSLFMFISKACIVTRSLVIMSHCFGLVRFWYMKIVLHIFNRQNATLSTTLTLLVLKCTYSGSTYVFVYINEEINTILVSLGL